MNCPAIARGQTPGGVRATASRPREVTTVPVMLVAMRRGKPPHALSSAPPTSIPMPKPELIQPSSTGPPRKYSVTRSGWNEKIGVMNTPHRRVEIMNQRMPRQSQM